MSASVLPLLVFSHSFRQLYFFHDDWELLDGAFRSSLMSWAFEPFLGESVIPVFKLLWIGAVRAFGGSYFALICLLWATHLAISMLFAWLLARFDAPLPAIAIAVLTFGISWSNIETLGWSMQWGSQLALLFFLIAWHALLRILSGKNGVTLYVICLVAGALSSSRGIISGLPLALFILLTARDRKQRKLLLIVSVLPAILMALVMYFVIAGHENAASIPAALTYAIHCFLLNPLYDLLPIRGREVGVPALFLYGALKVTVFGLSALKLDLRLRPLILSLLVLDIMNAAALGFGRFNQDLATTVSWRYQYIPLLCFGAIAGQLLPSLRAWARATVFVVWLPILAYPWQRHAPRWAGWRGVEIRKYVATLPPDAHFDPSSLTAGTARELTKTYHLH